MGTYKDKSEWVDEIYTVDTYTPVLGGSTAWAGDDPVSGYSNASIEQLANRTRWNRDTIESIERELGVKTDGVMLGKNNLSELTDIQEAKYRIELNLVDNVRDADKPVSAPQQTALNKKADKATTINTESGIEGGGNLSQNRVLKLTNAVWDVLNDVANKANSSVTIVAGNGLSGGGNLTTNRTINIGTPSETSVTSTNSASGSTHSHALSAGVKASLTKADEAAPLSYTNTELGKKADKTINVSAGIGLAGGGSLSANRTISLSPSSIESLGKADSALQPLAGHGLYPDTDKTKLAGISTGATKNATDAQLRDRATHTGVQPINTVTGLQDALDSKADNTDSRLTNAREWTASVVSQAEAEAGTATTARKWTAQRVKQAIAGWWATIGTAFGKSLLNSSNATSAKSTLEIHSVATTGSYNDLTNKPSIPTIPSLMTQTEANAGTATTQRTINAKVLVDTISEAVSGGVSADALIKANNLSDLPNKATARTNLGLGSSATRDVGTSAGNVMEVGAFGIGRESLNLSTPLTHIDDIPLGAFVRYNAIDSACVDAGLPSLGSGSNIRWWNVQSSGAQSRKTLIASEVFGTGSGGIKGRVFINTKHDSNWSGWGEIYSSKVFDPNSKQDKLTAGTNVSISGNTISATNTTYTTGTLAQLNAGTDTTGRLQTARLLNDWLNGKGYVTTDTKYSAGGGLTLSGTTFSLPVTVSGSGSYVQSVVQNTNGITVTLGTPPNTNTTYSAMSVAELRTGTATTSRAMTAKNINDFSLFVALSGTSITPNLNSGRNFTLSLSGNTTINNPTNLRSGQTGDIAITVGSTERTLSFGSAWKFAGGNVPETKANSITVISYKVVNASTIICGVGVEVK